MLLINALKNGLTLEELASKYAIKISRHAKYNNLVLFKYNQINSPMDNPLVQECRGVILDQDDNWRVICRPFNKFFNYGEPNAHTVDWSTAVVQEKLDGSLASMYWYDGKWHVSTSGTPDAGSNVNDFKFSFAELFWKTFEKQGLKLPAYTDVDRTFIFELCTPYNRVVVATPESKVVLIGLRDRFSGQETFIPDYNGPYPKVKSFNLFTVDEIMSTFSKLDPLQQEGYVVVDRNFNRIKVKHPGYVAIHHTIGSVRSGQDGKVSYRRIVELVKTGETDEIVANFPELKEDFNKVIQSWDKVISTITSDYEELKGINVQKDFAMKAKDRLCPDALFQLRSGKVTSVKEYLNSIPIDRVLSILGV